MKARVLGVAAGLALAVATSAAEAQFMSSPYPAIIAVPPPAQNLVLPKPAPKPAQPAKPASPPPDSSPPDLNKCYQGRARVC